MRFQYEFMNKNCDDIIRFEEGQQRKKTNQYIYFFQTMTNPDYFVKQVPFLGRQVLFILTTSPNCQ